MQTAEKLPPRMTRTWKWWTIETRIAVTLDDYEFVRAKHLSLPRGLLGAPRMDTLNRQKRRSEASLFSIRNCSNRNNAACFTPTCNHPPVRGTMACPAKGFWGRRAYSYRCCYSMTVSLNRNNESGRRNRKNNNTLKECLVTRPLSF